MFRVSGQTSSTNTWRPCVPNFKLLEGPVFRVYRDTDRHTPFSRERTVGFRRESAEWSSASSRSTTPSGAEKAQVSLSRVCSCNSIPRFLAHSVNPPPPKCIVPLKTQILKHSHLHSCARLIPRPPHRPRTSAQVCGGKNWTTYLPLPARPERGDPFFDPRRVLVPS